MSDFDPIDHLRKRSDTQSSDITKYVNGLNQQIEKTSDDQSKKYLQQYKFLLESLADLYSLSAVSLGQIQSHNEVLKALYGKVFGNKAIELPYKEPIDEGLTEVVKRIKEKEPTLNWLDRDLKELSKDLEKSDGKDNE